MEAINTSEELEPVQENEDLTTEVIPTAPVEENKPTTTKSRRGHQPRSIEELENVAVSEMTPAELQKYVTHLRDDNTVLRGQIKTLRDSFTGVQKQKQEIETAYNQLAVAAKTQIQFCKDTVAQAYKTLAYMQPLEVE